MIFGVSAFLSTGCGGANRPAGGVRGEPGDGVGARVTAAARDLDPAVRYAAARNDMAVEWIEIAGDGARVYHLVTIRNEPALVEARTDAWPADDRERVPTRLEARIGRFGEPERERLLVRDIAQRLRDLLEEPGTGGVRP